MIGVSCNILCYMRIVSAKYICVERKKGGEQLMRERNYYASKDAFEGMCEGGLC